MNRHQKREIERLRDIEGWSFGAIAKHMGLAKSTVSSHFLRREKKKLEDEEPEDPNKTYCLCCGKEIKQTPGKKQKRFCDKRCNDIYYNLMKRNKINNSND